MAQILDKQGLQHYANKMCNADNRKVGAKSLPTVLNEIDTAIDGFKHAFEQEYGNPVDMEIANNQNIFSVGTGNNVDKKDDVENSFTDLKISGNSLVNIIKAKNITLDASSDKTRTVSLSAATIKPSTQYTFIVFIYLNTADSRLRMTTSPGYPFIAGAPIAELKKTGVFITKLTSESNFDVKEISFNVNGGSGQVTFSCVLLEGDHTAKAIPQYFEGFQSIGEKQDNNHKITIESVNKNIISDSKWTYNNTITEGYLDNVGYTIKYSGTGAYVDCLSQTIYDFNTNKNKILPGTWYTLSFYAKGNSLRTYIYPNLIDGNIKCIVNGVEIQVKGDGDFIHKLNSDWKKITYTFKTKSEILPIKHTWNRVLFRAMPNDNSVVSCIMIEQGKIATEYKPQIIDNKDILLSEPLRGLPNGVKDTIEKINGEWKIIRRCKQDILTGNSITGFDVGNLAAGFSIGGNVNRLTFILNNAQWNTNKDDTILICDKFSFLNFHKTGGGSKERNCEAMCFHSSNVKNLNIHIAKTKFSEQNITAARSWLNSNPIKIVYELENYIIEDIHPVTLQCWNNGTITIDEVIPVETTHTVSLNKSAQIQKNIEELTSLRNRVKTLEEQYNKTALNQAYETELLKLDMKLDNII